MTKPSTNRFAWLKHWSYHVLQLLGLWYALVLLQSFVPRDWYLADVRLLPWLAVTLSACLLLRHNSLLPAPHPALVSRRSPLAAVIQRLTIALTPWVLLAFVEFLLDRQRVDVAHPALATVTMAGFLILIIGASVGHRHRLTAWNPRQRGYGWLVIGSTFLALFPLLIAAWWPDRQPVGSSGYAMSEFLTLPLYVGATFLLAGILATPPRDVGQFLSAQLSRPNRSIAQTLGLLIMPPLAAWLLATLGLGVFHTLYLLRYDALGFNGVLIHMLFVCMCTAALFPRPVPIAMACLFHEVRPAGAEKPQEEARVRDFTESPEGALVFNPLNVERTGRIHFCRIPVESNSLTLFESNAPWLWPLEGMAAQAHLFGFVSFESSGTKPQWQEVTIRKAARDVVSWKSEMGYNLQRMLILRPYTSSWFRRRGTVFDHEGKAFEGQIQSMGDLADTMSIQHGDLILLSIGGVIRAYEFEIGAPLYEQDLVAHERLPILEDYVSVA